MEPTSETVWKEETKSSVSKIRVQDVSTKSVQKLSSSSSSVGKQSVLLTMGSEMELISSQMITHAIEGMENISSLESSLLLTSPIETIPSMPEDAIVINTTSPECELATTKLEHEHGSKIGEQKQPVQTSSSVTSIDDGSKSTSRISSSTKSSSMMKKSATTVLTEAQESSSTSCSSFSTTNKLEMMSSKTKSLPSVKSSQSFEKVVKSSSTAVAERQDF